MIHYGFIFSMALQFTFIRPKQCTTFRFNISFSFWHAYVYILFFFLISNSLFHSVFFSRTNAPFFVWYVSCCFEYFSSLEHKNKMKLMIFLPVTWSTLAELIILRLFFDSFKIDHHRVKRINQCVNTVCHVMWNIRKYVDLRLN